MFLRSRAENVIIYIESVAEFRSIIRYTVTRTYVKKADLTKIPIIVDYRSRTKYVNSFSVRVNSKRYSPFR